MKKTLVLALSVLALQVQAQKKKTPVKPVSKKAAKPSASTVKLKTLVDSASYAMGVSMASFYVQQGIKNINPALVQQAIKDVMAGKPTPIKEGEANDIVMRLMNDIMAEKSKSVITVGETFLEENKKKPGVKTTASGLQYEVIKEGNGPRPTATDEVTVNYVGTLLDGTEFDNSYSRGQPATFPLTSVIKGWTEGVQLMTVGSKYKFYIPHTLGYGVHGTGPIPGGAALIFEVELLSIKGK